MRKIWNWMKWDYMRCTSAWYFIFNGKAPKWVPTVIYVILAPFGIALLPVAIIASKCLVFWMTRKLDKELRELEEV